MATATEMPTGKLLTAKQAAEFLGTTEGTLNVWRSTRAVEIPYVKLGKAVRYRVSDLLEFIEQNVHGARIAA